MKINNLVVERTIKINHNKQIMIYKRTINLSQLIKRKSFFLFGPRSTGKTTLIHQTFPNSKIYNLLDSRVYRKLVQRPELLEEENVKNKHSLIIIDEIQKIPSLLDEVHRLIQKRKFKFILTGSSARKLKRKGVNLLAGRAWSSSLFPLTYSEIPKFDLIKYANQGGLPHIYNNPDYKEELEAYVSLYLKEEIKNEALTRNVQAFSEFLHLIALSNGQEVNYDSFSKDLQISPSTLKNYIEILDDTLLGFKLPGYTKTKKRKAISRIKYYLFDVGVTNILCDRSFIQKKGELFGKVFEHFIILEIRAFLNYSRKNLNMNYWRSTSQMEVDIIVGGKIAIEIKASHLIQDKHLKGLRALKEEDLMKEYWVVSLDGCVRTTKDNIKIFPWNQFLNQLWKGQLL